jgi:hypothetical protein
MSFLPVMTLLEYSCMIRPKKEFKGKRTENETFFLHTKFGKVNVATLVLGSRLRQKGLQGCGPRGSPGVTSETPGSVGECEGVNHHTPKATPTLGDGVPMESRNFRDQFEGSKLNGLWRSLYHWKVLTTSMPKMGSHCSFGHLKHKLWPKEGARSRTTSLTPDQKRSRIDPIYLAADDVPHTVRKLSTRATTLLQTALRSEVCSQSYGASKSQESQLSGFQESRAGILCKSRERKTIWMWAPWRGPEYTIRGKVVASPKSGPWWVLCVRVARGSS